MPLDLDKTMGPLPPPPPGLQVGTMNGGTVGNAPPGFGMEPPPSPEQIQMAKYKMTELAFKALQRYRMKNRPSPVPGLRDMEEVEYLRGLGFRNPERWRDLANEIPIQPPGPEEEKMQQKAEASLMWGRIQVMEGRWSQDQYKQLERKIDGQLNAFRQNAPFQKKPTFAEQFQQDTFVFEDGSGAKYLASPKNKYDFDKIIDAPDPKDIPTESDLFNADQEGKREFNKNLSSFVTAAVGAAVKEHDALLKAYNDQVAAISKWNDDPLNKKKELPQPPDYNAILAKYMNGPGRPELANSFTQRQHQGLAGQMAMPQTGPMPMQNAGPGDGIVLGPGGMQLQPPPGPGPQIPQQQQGPPQQPQMDPAVQQRANALGHVDAKIKEYREAAGIPDFDIMTTDRGDPARIQKIQKIINAMKVSDLPLFIKALEEAF